MNQRLTILVTVLVVWLVLFGKALTSSESFVFRDAAHFYHPLFAWTSNELGNGKLPMWNPYDSLGIPHLADCTSSVLYPGKIIFLLPKRYSNRFALFVSLHVLLAAWGMYHLSTKWKCSMLASGLSSLSYAFGGIVIFQYCNIPYLISAAWLPFAASAAYEMVMRRHVRHAVSLGLVLSLMILGGDPQTAYHVVLATLGLVCMAIRSEGRFDADRNKRQRRHVTRRWRRHRMTLLIVAGLTCAGFAAVQLLPTTQWADASDRTAWESPRSVYELASEFARIDTESGDRRQSVWSGILGVTRKGTHAAKTFEFSIGPWRWPELVLPNFGGRQFPVSSRWMNRIPAEGRVWTPSLYMGVVPCVLALSVWRLRGGQIRLKWASWMVLVGLLACLGNYGAGWSLAELLAATNLLGAEGLSIGPQVGGVYWLFTVLLPGYAAFRYPAKIAVFVAMGISLLAGQGWDQAWSTGNAAPRRLLVWLMAVSAALAILSNLVGDQILQLLVDTPSDALFGPIDAQGGLDAIQHSSIRALGISFLSFCLLSLWDRSWSPAAATLLFMATATDLAASHRWLVPTADIESALRSSRAATDILSDTGLDHGPHPTRVCRPFGTWYPVEWKDHFSLTRQLDGLRWDVDTLRPRFHMAKGLGMIGPSGSIPSQAIQSLFHVSTARNTEQISRPMPHRSVLDALGVNYFILPIEDDMPAATPISGSSRNNGFRVCRNERAFPRAWIVHSVEQMPSLKTRRPSAVNRRTEQIFFPRGQPRDLSCQAVIETDDQHELSNRPAAQFSDDHETCRVVRYEPHRVELDVTLEEPGLIVLSDLFFEGWAARIIDQQSGEASEIPILRTNRVMRGVVATAGRFRVEFNYRPVAFYVGAVISGVAWSMWFVLVAVNKWRRSRHNRG